MSGNGKKRSAGDAPKPTKKRQTRDSDDGSDSEEKSPAASPEYWPEYLGGGDGEGAAELPLPEGILKQFQYEPGVLMIAGQVSWDLTGKRESKTLTRTHPNLNVFHRFTDAKYRLIVSGCNSAHSILVSEDGKAMGLGRNSNGQLGTDDAVTRDVPTLIPALQEFNTIYAATGRNHTLFLTDTGTVYACGDNRNGQCGVGNNPNKQLVTPTKINYRGPPIVKVACGADFSIILDITGVLYSFGLPENGQLGHNTDGKFFVTSNKLSFNFELSPKRIHMFVEKSKDGHITQIDDVAITDIACGTSHTVAIDAKKRAFSWGFGGFGRLGHAEQKDEMVPRLIKFFDTQNRGLRNVYCGGTYSLVINDLGALFLFGQTKRTGDANMYPKPVQDLAGWQIKCLGTSNTSIVIAAEESLIVWGAAPTYGELGLGDLTKSSTKPIEVPKMEGTKIMQVTMGYSHTLLLCNNTDPTAQEKISNMPVFTP